MDAYLTTSIGAGAQYPPLATATITTTLPCGYSYNNWEKVSVWTGLTLEAGTTYFITLTNPDQSSANVTEALWQLGGDAILENDATILNSDVTLITGGYWGNPNYEYPPASTDPIQDTVAVLYVDGCERAMYYSDAAATCLP